MKQGLIFGVIICMILISGCAKPEPELINRETAIEKLTEAGCWYDVSDDYVCVVFDGDYWIIQKEGCGGVCKIGIITQEIEMDVNPMCTGVLIPCETDEECWEMPSVCALEYECKDGACVAYFD